MKGCFSVIAFCILSVTSYAQSQLQTDSVKPRRNELKLNLLHTVIAYPEISYERSISFHSALGISFSTPLNPKKSDYPYHIIPYYRYYLGKSPTRGFFVEASSALVKVRDISNRFDPHLSFGFGAASGVKLITKRNIVLEAHLGLGYIPDKNWPAAYSRTGITIGKRF